MSNFFNLDVLSELQTLHSPVEKQLSILFKEIYSETKFP